MSLVAKESSVKAMQKEVLVDSDGVGCGILLGAGKDGKEGMRRRWRIHKRWVTMKMRESAVAIVMIAHE